MELTHDYDLSKIQLDLSLLKFLVNTDTRPFQYKGIAHCLEILEDEFISLGFKAKYVQNKIDQNALLVLKNHQEERSVALICHIDSVLSKSHKNQFSIDFEKQKIYGPGVGDNKASLIIILGAIKKYLSQQKDELPPLTIIISPSEEIGSPGFIEYFGHISKRFDFVFGFEPTLDQGQFISSRSGNRWYQFKLTGESFHCGRKGDVFKNSGHVIAQLITFIEKINQDYKEKNEKTYLNFGSFKTKSETYNYACGELIAKLDLRFQDTKTRDFIHQKIEEKIQKLNEEDNGAYIFYCIEDDCPAFSKKSFFIEDDLKSIYESATQKEFTVEHSKGAADINYLGNHSYYSLDGLGACGGKYHSENEFITYDSLKEKTLFLFSLLNYLKNNFYLKSNMSQTSLTFDSNNNLNDSMQFL